MNAGLSVLQEIMDALENGDMYVLQRLAPRYPKDSELQAIYGLSKGDVNLVEVKDRLRRLIKSRMFGAAGTYLPLKDRRNLSSDRKDTWDY